MWDTVRKIFSHDAASEDVLHSRNQTMPATAEAPSRADSDMSESGQDMAANAADVSGPRAPEEVASPAAHVPSGADAVEVSPPGHAPQGLAAEPEAHNAAATSSSAAMFLCATQLLTTSTNFPGRRPWRSSVPGSAATSSI